MIRTRTFTWTSDSDGDASVTWEWLDNSTITCFQTVPGENGDRETDVPILLYDVDITDGYGESLSGDTLHNRSISLAERVYPTQKLPVDSTSITIAVEHAGDSNKGIVNVTFETRREPK